MPFIISYLKLFLKNKPNLINITRTIIANLLKFLRIIKIIKKELKIFKIFQHSFFKKFFIELFLKLIFHNKPL